MCAYVCMHVYVYVCVYMHVWVCMYVYVYICVCVCGLSMCVCVCVNVWSMNVHAQACNPSRDERTPEFAGQPSLARLASSSVLRQRWTVLEK